MRPQPLIAFAVLATLLTVGLIVTRDWAQQPGRAPLLPFDRSMFEISSASGGDYYFWDAEEFAGSNLRVPIKSEDVLVAYPVLDGTHTFEFPVDSLTTRLEIFVGAQQLDEARILDEHGELGRARGNVELQEFEHMLIATIRNPDPGPWRIEVEGRGQLSLSVNAATDSGTLPPGSNLTPIHLIGFELVEQRGRPGHEGLFELKRPALPGEQLTARLVLAGSFASAELALVDADGEPLPATLPIPLRFPPDTDETHFNFVVPPLPYRVLIRGRDINGQRFQRIHSWLQTPGE